MSMISELIKDLKRVKQHIDPTEKDKFVCSTTESMKIIDTAIDTIETLSAKLSAANMGQSDLYQEDEVFAKIIEDLDKRIGTQLKIMSGLNDETYQYGYGKALEAYQQSKLMVEIDFEEYKEKRSADGGGWIACKDRLPEDGADVLVWFEYFRYGGYNGLFQTIGISYMHEGKWSGFVNGESGWNQLSIIAWQPLPKPYTQK